MLTGQKAFEIELTGEKMQHADDNELLGLLYGLHAGKEHVDGCGQCREQLAGLVASREAVRSAPSFEDIPSDLLHEQRRQVLQKLDQPKASWFGSLPVQRWASTAVVVAALASGVALYETKQEVPVATSKAGTEVTDLQLAEDVSQIAGTPEPTATGPLQALFAEQ